MPRELTVVGLGGSMRAESTSLSALQAALDGAAASGARTTLLDLRELGLPMYSPEHGIPPSAERLSEASHTAAAMICSSPTYQGPIGGALANAFDWMTLQGYRLPAYL